MTYQSVTTWQAEDYDVEVRYGFFSTIEAAVNIARNGIEGIVVDDMGLWVNLRDGTRAPVSDGGFTVRRLREQSRSEASHRVLTIDDFEVVAMSVEAMRNEQAMRSFGSQSYCVIDSAGMLVTLPN